MCLSFILAGDKLIPKPMYFSQQSYKQRNESRDIYTFIALNDTNVYTIFTTTKNSLPLTIRRLNIWNFFPFYHTGKTIIKLHL